MSDGVEVFVDMGETTAVAGRLFSHRKGQLESGSFTYSPGYISDPRAYALDPALPLASGAFQTPTGKALFGGFSDSAPDRWGRNLIVRAERHRADAAGDTPRTLGEYAFLLGVRDELRQGAIRFADDDGWLAGSSDGVPYLVDLPRLLSASDAIERDDPDANQLLTLVRAGSSLGGARPKAHVRDGNGEVMIAKFPRPLQDSWDVVRWESVALELARRSGIRAASSRLETADGRGVLLVGRFDRNAHGRVGYASAMTMLEATDGDARSYVEIAEVLEEEGSQTVVDLHELWRRLVFGILIRNSDDHLRNHGFLRTDRSGWTLSPAFDVNPNPENGNGTLSTSIDGTTDEARLDVAFEVADLFRLSRGQATAILRDVSVAVSDWRSVAVAHGCVASELRLMERAFVNPECDWARDVLGR